VNKYGQMASSHWARWLPRAYAAIPEPDSYFSAIGQEAARQVDELASQLAGDSQPGEAYLQRAGRLTAARSQAEEVILPQRVLPPPETGENQSPEEDGHPAPGTGRPAAISPDHPMWAEVNAEQRERLGLDG
jgi:hypothetical protein